MTPLDEELLEGMCNCYSACGEGFEETVRMVAGARDRTPEDVKEALQRLATESKEEENYRALRRRLPVEFPL